MTKLELAQAVHRELGVGPGRPGEEPATTIDQKDDLGRIVYQVEQAYLAIQRKHKDWLWRVEDGIIDLDTDRNYITIPDDWREIKPLTTAGLEMAILLYDVNSSTTDKECYFLARDKFMSATSFRDVFPTTGPELVSQSTFSPAVTDWSGGSSWRSIANIGAVHVDGFHGAGDTLWQAITFTEGNDYEVEVDFGEVSGYGGEVTSQTDFLPKGTVIEAGLPITIHTQNYPADNEDALIGTAGSEDAYGTWRTTFTAPAPTTEGITFRKSGEGDFLIVATAPVDCTSGATAETLRQVFTPGVKVTWDGGSSNGIVAQFISPDVSDPDEDFTNVTFEIALKALWGSDPVASDVMYITQSKLPYERFTPYVSPNFTVSTSDEAPTAHVFISRVSIKERIEGTNIQNGIPTYFTLLEDQKTIVLDRKPTNVTNPKLKMRYRKPAHHLIGDADTPLMPSEFHQVIVWRAARDYVGNDDSEKRWAYFNERYREAFFDLKKNQLPNIELP